MRDWWIEANRIEQFDDTALAYASHGSLIRQTDGTDAAATGKYLVVWRRKDNGQWLIHARIANSDDSGQ